MQLTRTGDYALRAMLHLASNPYGKFVNIWEISKVRDVPEKFLRKIIPKLVQAGYIKTLRGRDGGILLNRSAHTISVLDIIECVEGPLILNRCLVAGNECSQISFCELHEVWQEAQDQLRQSLQNKKLAHLLLNRNKTTKISEYEFGR